MTPNPKFRSIPKKLWADIKLISQQVGYTERGEGRIKIPTVKDIAAEYRAEGLRTDHLFDGAGSPTVDGQLLLDYFIYRAQVLDKEVQHYLMDADEARQLFDEVRSRIDPNGLIALPMNKQKGEKKSVNYLTAMVILLLKEALEGKACNIDPRTLTTITQDGAPLRTLSRRVDGAFPSPVNPIAIWEIKEYYFTTTFGSRVADGIYETLLDGLELEELHLIEGRKVLHYLIVDAKFTWWGQGKSYLCRMIDMLHMGYVDEVIFGREVAVRLPALAKEWLAMLPPD